MSQRFPPAPSSTITTNLDLEVEKHHGPNPNFAYKDADGAPMGPFAVLAYTPDVFAEVMAMGNSILHQPSLTQRMRELAILAVIAAWPTPFVEYAHRRIAETLNPRLSEEQINAACKGDKPSNLTEEEEITYETALSMARGIGSIEDELWKKAESKLGTEGMARLGHVVGFYLYSCCLLRLGRVGVPKEG